MTDITISEPRALAPQAPADLSVRVARSVKWSFLYNAIPRLLTPFSTMILAALLTPADFGLVAVSTFVIALARIVVEMGLGKTVIQRRNDVDLAASTALWMSLLVSGFLYIGLWYASPFLARAYKNAMVSNVIRVAALALPCASLVAIPSALLRRRMEFRSLFWVNTAFLVISAIASVSLALLRQGAWSLIWGQLAGLAFSAVLALRLSKWRPALAIHWPLLRSMSGFGGWVMLAAFLNWLFFHAGSTIAGLFLSTEGLGVFALGFSVAILIPGFLASSLEDVVFPAFCEIQGNLANVGKNLAAVQSLAAAVLCPIVLTISAIAPTLVRLLYGSKWQGLGTVISVLSVMPGLGYIWSLNQAAYEAVGRPDLWTKMLGSSLAVILPILWLAAHFGLTAFTLSRFAGGWIVPLANVYLCSRILKVRLKDQFRSLIPSLPLSLGVFAVLSILIRQGGPFEGLVGLLKLLTMCLAAGLGYLGLLRFLRRDLWDLLFLNLRRALS